MINLNKQLKERRMIELDPGLAKAYLEHNTYKGQRAVRPAYVQHLIKEMIAGNFRYGNVAFASENGNPDVMVDGQHVCHAVVKSNITVPCSLEKYELDNTLDLAEAYMRFNILDRSQTDYTKAFAIAVNVQWPLWISGLLVSTIKLDLGKSNRFYGNSGSGGTHSSSKLITKEEAARALPKYLKEGAFIYRLLNPDQAYTSARKTFKHITRAPIVFVMFKTYRINETMAFDFWEKVRDGEHLTKQMPEMQLREFLMNTNPRETTNHKYIYKAILAWNASITNKTTNLAYREDHSVPKLKGISINS